MHLTFSGRTPFSISTYIGYTRFRFREPNRFWAHSFFRFGVSNRFWAHSFFRFGTSLGSRRRVSRFSSRSSSSSSPSPRSPRSGTRIPSTWRSLRRRRHTTVTVYCLTTWLVSVFPDHLIPDYMTSKCIPWPHTTVTVYCLTTWLVSVFPDHTLSLSNLFHLIANIHQRRMHSSRMQYCLLR